jgi:hypothetical protein
MKMFQALGNRSILGNSNEKIKQIILEQILNDPNGQSYLIEHDSTLEQIFDESHIMQLVEKYPDMILFHFQNKQTPLVIKRALELHPRSNVHFLKDGFKEEYIHYNPKGIFYYPTEDDQGFLIDQFFADDDDKLNYYIRLYPDILINGLDRDSYTRISMNNIEYYIENGINITFLYYIAIVFCDHSIALKLVVKYGWVYEDYELFVDYVIVNYWINNSQNIKAHFIACNKKYEVLMQLVQIPENLKKLYNIINPNIEN